MLPLPYPVAAGFEQVELFGFGETEEMKQCRAAQNKLEPLLRIYFDSSWRKIDNEASARACMHRSRRSMRRAAGHGTCVPACEGRAASAGSCEWAAMAVVPAGQAVHQGGACFGGLGGQPDERRDRH